MGSCRRRKKSEVERSWCGNKINTHNIITMGREEKREERIRDSGRTQFLSQQVYIVIVVFLLSVGQTVVFIPHIQNLNIHSFHV